MLNDAVSVLVARWWSGWIGCCYAVSGWEGVDGVVVITAVWCFWRNTNT